MSLKKKTLIIKANNNDLISKTILNRGYQLESMYSGGKNVLTRFLRRFFIRYSLPFYKKWFNKKILKYDVENIIVFDSLLSEKFIEWLYKKSNVNIHVWYWNIVKIQCPL